MSQLSEIPLSRGAMALVSPEDHLRISARKWTLDSTGYAVCKINRRKVLMHRVVTGAAPGMDVDHVDGDKLNNTRENLRIATRSQNAANRGPTKGKFKGVHWRKDRQKWVAAICVEGKKIHIGHFHRAIDAAIAYNEHAWAAFGEFAYLNPVGNHE